MKKKRNSNIHTNKCGLNKIHKVENILNKQKTHKSGAKPKHNLLEKQTGTKY